MSTPTTVTAELPARLPGRRLHRVDCDAPDVASTLAPIEALAHVRRGHPVYLDANALDPGTARLLRDGLKESARFTGSQLIDIDTGIAVHAVDEVGEVARALERGVAILVQVELEDARERRDLHRSLDASCREIGVELWVVEDRLWLACRLPLNGQPGGQLPPAGDRSPRSPRPPRPSGTIRLDEPR